MREARVRTGAGKFGQQVTVGSHSLLADEAPSAGGDDTGPDPHEFLLVALGACTSMTLKVYADRKGWALRGVDVRVSAERDPDRTFVFHRTILLDGDLDAEQRDRLLEIANKCPVHRTLVGTMRIESTLV